LKIDKEKLPLKAVEEFLIPDGLKQSKSLYMKTTCKGFDAIRYITYLLTYLLSYLLTYSM